MKRLWFDIFSIFVIIFILVSFVMYYGKFIDAGLSFNLMIAAFILFIIRTFLRMIFYIKDRKK